VGDRLSDNGYGHAWTYTDVGGLFPQLTVHIGLGQDPLWIAWGSSAPSRSAGAVFSRLDRPLHDDMQVEGRPALIGGHGSNKPMVW
jgi:hypothetical protein